MLRKKKKNKKKEGKKVYVNVECIAFCKVAIVSRLAKREIGLIYWLLVMNVKQVIK